MKRSLSTYLISWALLIAVFNVICFIIPGRDGEARELTAAFWVGYAMVMLTLLLHLIYAVLSLSKSDRDKRLLNVPIMAISIVEFVIMAVVGAVCMLLPGNLFWIGVIVCCIVLAFSVILYLTSVTVHENLAEANSALNAKTSNYRSAVDTATLLISKAKTPVQRDVAKKIYDAIKYSDSVSSDETFEIENRIESAVATLLADFNGTDNDALLNSKTDDILLMIQQRNNICAESKRR
ncbi:MAG: hypothetical protein IJL63_08320 [Clostridia bacterium]|nr:hypothetical protein [Clostridia bacterium]